MCDSICTDTDMVTFISTGPCSDLWRVKAWVYHNILIRIGTDAFEASSVSKDYGSVRFSFLCACLRFTQNIDNNHGGCIGAQIFSKEQFSVLDYLIWNADGN